jgi:hypothetical protein
MSSQRSGIGGGLLPGQTVFKDYLSLETREINIFHRDLRHWMLDRVISAAKEKFKWKSIGHSYSRRGRDNVPFIE